MFLYTDLQILWPDELNLDQWIAVGVAESGVVFNKKFKKHNQCSACGPSTKYTAIGWICTRFKNHLGPHVACSYRNTTDRRAEFLQAFQDNKVLFDVYDPAL